MNFGDITISQAWLWFLAACAAVVSIAKAGEIIKRWVGRNALKEDIRKTNERMEAESARYRELLDADNRRIKELEKSNAELQTANAVIMQALLALINHSIDGNNIQGLKDTRNSLSKYLINRQ